MNRHKYTIDAQYTVGPCADMMMPDSSSMNNSFDRFLSRKFRESPAKEWAKVSMHFEGGGPVSRAEKK